MPNYNYRSNDYMRRSQNQRPAAPLPLKIEREYSCCEKENCASTCVHDLLNGMPLAMAYVPWQDFKDLYPAEKALCRGTIFEELDKPFSGKGGSLR